MTAVPGGKVLPQALLLCAAVAVVEILNGIGYQTALPGDQWLGQSGLWFSEHQILATLTTRTSDGGVMLILEYERW